MEFTHEQGKTCMLCVCAVMIVLANCIPEHLWWAGNTPATGESSRRTSNSSCWPQPQVHELNHSSSPIKASSFSFSCDRLSICSSQHNQRMDSVEFDRSNLMVKLYRISISPVHCNCKCLCILDWANISTVGYHMDQKAFCCTTQTDCNVTHTSYCVYFVVFEVSVQEVRVL